MQGIRGQKYVELKLSQSPCIGIDKKILRVKKYMILILVGKKTLTVLGQRRNTESLMS